MQNFNISDLVIDKNYINPAILDHEILFDNKVDALSQFNIRLKELIAQSKSLLVIPVNLNQQLINLYTADGLPALIPRLKT